jgi:molecular chaperone DnaJ
MTCAGSGAAPGTYPKTCPNCDGTGIVTQGLGQFGVQRACPACGGKGTVIEEPCPDCKGTGQRRGKHKISVRIPAGIQDGGKLRVRGEGNVKPNGGRGDLIITVKVKASKQYQRDGLDTNSSIELNLSDAVMGCQKVIKTPQGSVKIKIPAGVTTGKKIRVKKKGIHDERTGRKGDHYVEVTVEIPKNMNAKQKKLFKEYSAAMGWDKEA